MSLTTSLVVILQTSVAGVEGNLTPAAPASYVEGYVYVVAGVYYVIYCSPLQLRP